MRGGGGGGRQEKRGVRALGWVPETPWREGDPIGRDNARGRSSEVAGEIWPQWGALGFQQEDCGLKQTQTHICINITIRP